MKIILQGRELDLYLPREHRQHKANWGLNQTRSPLSLRSHSLCLTQAAVIYSICGYYLLYRMN